MRPGGYVEFLQQQADRVAQGSGFQAAVIADPELFSQNLAQAAQVEEQMTGQPSETRAVIESEFGGGGGFDFFGPAKSFGSGVANAVQNPTDTARAIGGGIADAGRFALQVNEGPEGFSPETRERLAGGAAQLNADFIAGLNARTQPQLDGTEGSFARQLEIMDANFGRPFKPLVPESAAGVLPEGPVRRVGEAATQLTSPFDLGLTAATAGAGPGIVKNAAGPGARNAIIRSVLGPITKGPLAERIAAEAAVGTGAVLAGQEASERLPDNPLINIPGSLAAGLVGGGGTLAGIQGVRKAASPAVRQAVTDQLAPRAVVNAATDPPTGGLVPGDFPQGPIQIDEVQRAFKFEQGLLTNSLTRSEMG